MIESASVGVATDVRIQEVESLDRVRVGTKDHESNGQKIDAYAFPSLSRREYAQSIHRRIKPDE